MISEIITRELRLDIAGIIVSVLGTDDGRNIRIEGDACRFTGKGSPEIILKAHVGAIPPLNLKKQVFDSGGNWSLFKDNTDWIFSLHSPITGPEPYAVAVVNSDFSKGDIYLRELENLDLTAEQVSFVNPLEYPLDEVLMVHLLSQGRGVLLHACGISYQGKGMLFVGVSGAGKSTIANFWKQEKKATILSDDRIIVRNVDSRFWMYGTPWHGDARLCAQEKAPLERIYFLKQAKENSLFTLNPVSTASRLLVCSFPTFWDKKGMEFTLDFCLGLTQNIACFELSFLRDASILDLVKSQI